MNYRQLIGELKELGFYLSREGSNHEIWYNNTISIAVPRKRTISMPLAKKILLQARKNES